MIQKLSTTETIEEKLRDYYPASKANYITSILPPEELQSINDSPYFSASDMILLAKSKRAVKDKMGIAAQYDEFHVKDMHHYLTLEREWIEVKKSALEKQLERTITYKEIVTPKNCLSFRMFYCLRHPDLVER